MIIGNAKKLGGVTYANQVFVWLHCKSKYAHHSNQNQMIDRKREIPRIKIFSLYEIDDVLFEVNCYREKVLMSYFHEKDKRFFESVACD